jgi:dipeptidyl-peptidase-4
VSAENDGVYLEADPSTDNLILKNIVTGESSTFVDASNLGFDYYASFTQPSQEHVMFAANYTKQYRHSYFADYYVYNRGTGAVAALVPDQKGDIQYAVWSPVGDTIAFVRGNDLYIWNNGTVTRVTHDGGPDVFNGVPDWVYEEGWCSCSAQCQLAADLC